MLEEKALYFCAQGTPIAKRGVSPLCNQSTVSSSTPGKEGGAEGTFQCLKLYVVRK